jgi:hypothetical protein
MGGYWTGFIYIQDAQPYMTIGICCIKVIIGTEENTRTGLRFERPAMVIAFMAMAIFVGSFLARLPLTSRDEGDFRVLGLDANQS